MTSTSAPLFTVPTSVVPRRASARSLIGHAGIEIARRPVQLNRQPHAASGAPFVDALGRQRAGDGDEDAAGRRSTGLGSAVVDGPQRR